MPIKLMKLPRVRRGSHIQFFTVFICLMIIGGWILSALHHGLSIFETQKSDLLLSYGAVNAASLQKAEYWRLITSQLLHVKFLHMLFNIIAIYYVGSKIEKQFGATVISSIYLIAGTTGQLASVLAYPQLVSSGASQALCGILGALISLVLFRSRVSKLTIILVSMLCSIQAGLDLSFAGSIKAGHSVGFVVGLLIGLFVRPRIQRVF